MIDEVAKADIRKRIGKAKADSAPVDVMALALHYEAQSDEDQVELAEFIRREAQKTGASIRVNSDAD